MKQINKLIINSPYEQPKYFWHYDREHRSFEKRATSIRRDSCFVPQKAGIKETLATRILWDILAFGDSPFFSCTDPKN